ncbi:putative RING/U-box superfamily protein [Tripterygium wilfordii]|uniref:Putative RING/U-box superfamily protein n=1 Tax=Tripterygium wilfordii TaxID=458696 RepID=A0A7J7C7W3_TRIWF|nr:E4 SUMO-protein ligase PIAL2-like [Tripterygium wilfordii]KAF5730035.1 putative RING/U-box superfamily protein [Tripterygium wilfordii]
MSSSMMNSFRVAAVTDRLLSHLQSGRESNAKEIFNLCLSLARGIDFALANNEIPDKAEELPRLLKQICQRKHDLFLQAAVMVLMISVKNACKIGWFLEMESQELLTLANEIGSHFCSTGDVQIGPSDFPSTMSMIMGRFYPLMKMGQILASLEVKPGYGAYVVDFHISKTIRHSPQEKIRLLVVQTDYTETSACIISPQQVNFLLNGKGVERRSGALVDHGPQIPTNVTGMLKYGTNLLQAVGQFNGHCIIVIAFMGFSSLPQAPLLEDYVSSGAPTIDLENDIIEGPSRISLKCPISFGRIAIPVKGCRCKHLQCFDFSNYVDINSRRPSWRCPHCNQHVCYTELRIDQNMAKVLREVREDVTEIIISADGSWKAVLERDDNEDVAHDTELHHSNKKTECQESTRDSTPGCIILDLTNEDDKMDAAGSYENEDRKTVQADLQNPSAVANFMTQSDSDLNNINVSSQNTAQIEDDFWSDLFLSSASVASHVRSDAQIRNSTSESTAADFPMPPVLTDAISPACNRGAEEHGNIILTTSAMQSQFSGPTNLQNEYGRSASAPRNITRTPVAVQALPALSQTQAPEQRARSIYTTPSLASQTSLPVARSVNNYSMGSDVASSSVQHHTAAQNLSLQDRQSVQQATGIQASTPFPGAYKYLTDFQNPHLQQALNLRMPQGRNQSPSLVQSSFPQTQTQQGAIQVRVGQSGGAGYSQPVRFASAIPQAAQMATQSPSVPAQIQMVRPVSSYPMNPDEARASIVDQRGSLGGRMHPVSRADDLVDLPSEQNWRPVSRMRGSLSGRAYSAALSQFMNLPPQPAQVSQASTNLTSPTSSVPPHLQAFFANRSVPPHLQSQNIPRAGAAGTSGLSNVLPGNSMGMN